MSDESKKQDQPLEQKVQEQQQEQPAPQAQPAPQPAQRVIEPQIIYVREPKKNKMSFGTKAAIGAGVVGYGVYKAGKGVIYWLRNLTFKRVIKTGLILGIFYVATHPMTSCNAAKGFFKDSVKPAYTQYIDSREAKQALEQEKQRLCQGQTALQQELSKKESELKKMDQSFDQLKNENYKLGVDKKSLEEKLKEKKPSQEVILQQHTRSQERGIDEPDRSAGRRSESVSPATYSDNKTPVVFVQKKGTTLAEIARQFTGDSSNWRELAAYNEKDVSGNSVIIYMGEKIEIPSKYAENSTELKWLNKNDVPRKYFKKERGESLDEAMIRNLGGLWREKEILDYNRKLMPSINLNEQEIFWVPAKM